MTLRLLTGRPMLLRSRHTCVQWRLGTTPTTASSLAWHLACLCGCCHDHRVDDMLTVEGSATAPCSCCAWRQLARLCGWNVTDRTSPPPSQIFEAAGAQVDLQPLPKDPAVLRILKARCEALQETLRKVRESGRSWLGEAARFAGRLVFATTQHYGCEGRAKLRRFIRREHERKRRNINTQLVAVIESCWNIRLHVKFRTDWSHATP